MSHTPGPWHVDPQFLRNVLGKDEEQVATAAHMVREHQANARLITAAPDLLAAIGDALTYLGDAHGMCDWADEKCEWDDEAHTVLRVLEVAIAKAVGE